jgi:hypothetical protein
VSAGRRLAVRGPQGSLDRVTAITGSTAQSLSFDAFGKRRNTDWSNDNTNARFADNQWLERGYTGHQQLDGVRLIHRCDRTYHDQEQRDRRVGR